METVGLITGMTPNYGIDPAFWAGRRVLVTGNTGFKGTWLTVWLHDLGAVVGGLSLPPPTTPSMFVACETGRLATQHDDDIRDASAVRDAMRAFSPEIVIHMAAQAIVRSSYDDPVATFATNIQGTVNVLESCRHVEGVRAVVVCTSDKCYQNDDAGEAFRENDRLGGHDPYSASKACAELVTSAYRQSFFSTAQYSRHRVALASVRAGNVIGGGDWADDRLLPDAARAFSAGQPLVIRHPKARRPWQFVLEPLAGYLALARALVENGTSFANAWNFGPTEDSVWCVEDLAREFQSAWNPQARVIIDQASHTKREAAVLRLDSSQAALRLGWQPRLDVREALHYTADWYRAFYGGAGSDALLELTRAHLRAYTSANAVVGQ